MSVQKLRIKKGFSFTTVSTKVIQNIKNYEELGLYVYLLSLPEDWIFHKKQLADHAGIGREKINKMLKSLHAQNLIEFAQMRDDKGKFAPLDLHVKDGLEFKINELQENEKDCAPLTEKPLTDSRLPVNSTYIRNNNKVDNKQIKDKNYCASDDARKSFDDFWNLYPRKKDKARAFKLWKEKRCSDKAPEIMNKLSQQILNDTQWNSIQYIPHPTTYLRNERWEDEVTLEKMDRKKESGAERALRMCMN